VHSCFIVTTYVHGSRFKVHGSGLKTEDIERAEFIEPVLMFSEVFKP
jgi:hypothetical protein